MRCIACLAASVVALSSAAAQDIKPVQAKPIEPVTAREIAPVQGRSITPDRPAQTPEVYRGRTVTPEPARTPTPEVNKPTNLPADAAARYGPAHMPANGNPVEPLSIPLRLSMRKNDILRAFDDPKPGWDRRTLDYGKFLVQVGGMQEEIWHFTIREPGVTLSSGLGVGSTRADVRAVFGSAYPGDVGQYRISFRYNGDIIREIKIDPANGSFTSVAANDAPSSAPSNLPSPSRPTPSNAGRTPSPAPAPAPVKTNAGSVYGHWVGHTQALTGGFYTVGTLDLNPDGSYVFGNGGKGRFKVEGNKLTFTSGPLTAWDNGRATRTKTDAIEFQWTNKDGSQQWFAFIR